MKKVLFILIMIITMLTNVVLADSVISDYSFDFAGIEISWLGLSVIVIVITLILFFIVFKIIKSKVMRCIVCITLSIIAAISIIVLIPVSLYKFGNNRWAVVENQNPTLSMEAFNSQYDFYIGNDKSREQVRGVIRISIASNINYDNHHITINNTSPDISMEEEYMSNRINQKYIIKGEYDSEGYIKNIIIEPAQQVQQNKSGDIN